VLASCVNPEAVNIRPMSYRWLSELSFRDMMTAYLIRHDLSSVETESGWALRPSNPDASYTEFAQRVAIFKKDALCLIYQLADCTVGMKNKHTVRARQIEFLEELDKLELATLSWFVKALGLGYRRMSSTAHGVANEGLARECMCVFEDKVLRYGPFLAWAAVAGPPEAHQWFSLVLQQGLNDLRAFEGGIVVAYSSLQSVLWLLFCRKAQCNLGDGWPMVLQIIEQEIASYKV
jgi:hypothetical protein